jgi:penicillin-binding protein 1A
MLSRLKRAAGQVRRRTGLPPLGLQDALVYALLAALACGGILGTVWTGRHILTIHDLRRGVGDTVFFGRDGRPWFRMDEHRRDVPLARIAPHFRHAVVAVEDHRFNRHPGVDPIALARAVVHNLRALDLVEGGSTITQQLARTLFLSNARTWGRKAKEAVLAVLLEQQLSKDQILELYLNRVYMGSGRYGVEAMSRVAFGKAAADVSLAEAALLAGLIRAPSTLSPWSNYKRARERSAVVLARMRQEGYITAQAEAGARAARLRLGPPPGVTEARGGYAKEYLRQEFLERFGGDHPPDWEVHTTFLPVLQDLAERAVAEGLSRLRIPELQAALVALDPYTGDVLALVGGRDVRSSPFNRAVRARRQPGSAFKPFVYAAALERGFTPVSVLRDLRSVQAAGRPEWMPATNGDSPDSQTLREALAVSNNQAAVALQRQVGTGAVRGLAGELGLRDLPDVASLALGTGLVRPLDLTAAFAAFPNGGFAVQPRALVEVVEADGSIALREPVRSRRVLSEASAFQVLTLLQDVVDSGTGAAVREWGVRFPVGGKTGTTDDFKDAWFVGFSSAVVVGVWVGFDQPATIRDGAYAARIALPIWADFMRRAARILPPQPFETGAELVDEELCRVSYLRPVIGCPTYLEYFKPGDPLPSQLCRLHEGSFKQRARRTVEGWLASLGRKLGRILR